MKAHVEGGLLDKILKTPEGGTLRITTAEAQGILSSRALPIATGGPEIIQDLTTTGRCVLLGRTLIVE